MKILSKLKIPKGVMIGIAILVVVLIALIVIVLSKKDKQAMPVYNYSGIEQQLADNVTDYINANVVFPETATAEIANEAVNNYRIIIRSDIDVVNDDHTIAIQNRIKSAFDAVSEDNDRIDLSEENEDGLSAGIAEIVWSTILSQIQTVTHDSNLESDYFYLAESIQGQIDKLEERKTKVSIQANIKNNAADMSPEELLLTVEGMTDQELQELMDLLGLSYDELYDLLTSANRDFDKELEDRLDSLREELQKELSKELSDELSNELSSATNGTNGKAGQNGKDGRDGQDGQDGKDGKNGTDGLNGKTTYIAYADDASGSNFSLTPTETSKYVGTCITDATKQPTDLASYSNWQPYRSHIITETTDENGVTTVHIH